MVIVNPVRGWLAATLNQEISFLQMTTISTSILDKFENLPAWQHALYIFYCNSADPGPRYIM